MQRRSLKRVGCLLEWAAAACAVPGACDDDGKVEAVQLLRPGPAGSLKKEFVRYTEGRIRVVLRGQGIGMMVVAGVGSR